MQRSPTDANPGSTPDLKKVIARGFRTFGAFCGLLQVRDKTGRRVPFRLNRTQRQWIAQRTKRDVCLKGRQVGLTTVILALMVYRFLTVPGARVVIVCQAMAEDKNVKEISTTVDIFLQSLEALGVELNFRTRTTTSWELEGRDAKLDIITAGASEDAAEKKFRSRTITHLHCTEVAYWEYADATLRGALNAVPPEKFGSEIVLECTANGAAGPFFEYCESSRTGSSGFEFHFYPWYTHEEYREELGPGETVEPRTALQRRLIEVYGLSQEQLKYWQGKVAEARGDEDFVAQELPNDPDTCFLVSGRGFFDKTKIGDMLARAKVTTPLRAQRIREPGFAEMRDGRDEVPGLRVWVPPELGTEYVVSADTSEGDGGSAGAAVVFERRTGRHCATLWGQAKPWVLAKWAVRLARKYNNALLVIERNNHGHAVLRAAHAEQKYRNIFADRDNKLGWLNGPTTRAPALDAFDAAVRDGHFRTVDPQLLREMRTFVTVLKGMTERAQHAKGARDDLVLTAAIGWDVLCRPRKKRDDWADQLPAA